MLIRFSFKNFKSFKNENLLDMEATSLKEHEYNVVKNDNALFEKITKKGKTYTAIKNCEYMEK